jgi:mannose-6-phosphate isomerase-like protein (cupin superfamily)
MKREESLIQTDTVRVRVMELLPGDATPWHFHREVTDHMVCLSGVIVVHLKQPTAMLELQPGHRCTVEVGKVHRVANDSPIETARYLLIQGVGRYDFITVDSE